MYFDEYSLWGYWLLVLVDWGFFVIRKKNIILLYDFKKKYEKLVISFSRMRVRFCYEKKNELLYDKYEKRIRLIFIWK